jgi:hypothetical protein
MTVLAKYPGDEYLNIDAFLKSPISALRFISQPLRRTVSTPRVTKFARLDLGLFTKPSKWMTFYGSINLNMAGRSI